MPLATHLATLLLAVCTLLAGPAASQPPPPVTKEDLLVVFGTHEHHASLIQVRLGASPERHTQQGSSMKRAYQS